MRLIDGDDLYELVDGGFDLDFDEVPETKAELLEMISKQETIDAVQVVRCKDCKYGDWYTTVEGKRFCYCTVHESSAHTVEDFCSYGEREADD